MIKHIVIWTISDTFSAEEKKSIAFRIKTSGEALIHEIPELQSIRIITDLLDTSTADIYLESFFDSVQDMQIYQDHPKHQELAGFVKTVIASRTAIDFKENES